jgi:hypothetical protein
MHARCLLLRLLAGSASSLISHKSTPETSKRETNTTWSFDIHCAIKYI